MGGVRSNKKRPNPKPAPPSRQTLTEDEALGHLLRKRLRKQKPLDLDKVLKADYGQTLDEF